jgi:hypothetical protein
VRPRFQCKVPSLANAGVLTRDVRGSALRDAVGADAEGLPLLTRHLTHQRRASVSTAHGGAHARGAERLPLRRARGRSDGHQRRRKPEPDEVTHAMSLAPAWTLTRGPGRIVSPSTTTRPASGDRGARRKAPSPSARRWPEGMREASGASFDRRIEPPRKQRDCRATISAAQGFVVETCHCVTATTDRRRGLTGRGLDHACSGCGKSCSRCRKSSFSGGNSRCHVEGTWRHVGVSCLLVEMSGCRTGISRRGFRMVRRRIGRSSVVDVMHRCARRTGSVDTGSSRRDGGISSVGFRIDRRRSDLSRDLTGETWSVVSHSSSDARFSHRGGGSNRRGFRSSSVRRLAHRCLSGDRLVALHKSRRALTSR